MSFADKRIIMFIVSVALFMDVLDSNVINTAVPAMAHTFHVNPIDIKIGLISYLLSLAIFIPMSGWAADKYGIKIIFISALGLFTLSSFFCGYASTLKTLVIARSIQGIGGAFMISLGRLLIARTFKRFELMKAMNVVITVVSLAVMLGPFVGGVIVDHFSWPWIFWINIPVGIVVMLIATRYLKESGNIQCRPFDFFGFILFSGSLALFCFSLSELSETQCDLYAVMTRLFIAVVLMMTYILHARKKIHPVVKIDLFKIRTFRISVIGNMVARIGFGGVPFLLPLLQQVGLGFSAQLSGLLLAPIALGIMVSKATTAKILRSVGYRKYLLVNTVLVSLSLFTFQFISAHTPIYFIALLTFIFGILISAQYTGMNSLALADIKDEALSASTSITSTNQILSQSFGVAVCAILLRIFASRSDSISLLTPAVFHQVFFSLGVLTVLAGFIFLGLKTNDGQQMFLQTKSPH